MHRQLRIGVEVGCLAVLGEGVHRALRLVHRKLVTVHTQAVAVCVSVGECAGQQHLVRGVADTGNHVGGRECGLLHLGEEVAGVAVQGEVADRNQRVVLLRPGLGEVEGVELVGGSLVVRHDLYLDVPHRVVAALDGLEEVAAGVVGVLARPAPQPQRR